MEQPLVVASLEREIGQQKLTRGPTTENSPPSAWRAKAFHILSESFQTVFQGNRLPNKYVANFSCWRILRVEDLSKV